MNFNLTVFITGCIGGALAEILKWYQLRESPNMPTYVKSPLYWIVTLLMVIAGGTLAVVQGIEQPKPLLALNVGLSAPLVLKGLAMAVPSQPSARDVEATAALGPSVIDFVAGR